MCVPARQDLNVTTVVANLNCGGAAQPMALAYLVAEFLSSEGSV